MAQITYENKVKINDSSLPAINKVRDVDMNEIKSVVNTNYNEQEETNGLVENATTISNVEKVVGTYNNKPLYSKTYTFTINHTGGNSTVESNYAHGIANIDTVFIDQAHSYAATSGNSYILGRTYINNGAIALAMSTIANSTNIRTEIFYNGSLTFDFTITLNYTKTTD